jgi:hypothetical protein
MSLKGSFIAYNLLLVFSPLSGTGAARAEGADSSNVAISVRSEAYRINIGAIIQLSATVTGTPNKAVRWSVAEGASAGSISSSGVYKAPTVPGVYHLVATSLADDKKQASVAITVVSLQ